MVTLFGSELRRAREALGWSREKFAEEVCFSISLVEKVESGSKFPSEAFAGEADKVLQTDGFLSRIRLHTLKQDVVPEWFRAWPDIEEQASLVRLYEPLVVPGPMQTEDYARTLLVDDDQVAARLARASILDPGTRPDVVAVLDEAVLHRQIGNREIMREQLQRLAEAPVSVQVVPSGAETYYGVDGSFCLATVDGKEISYVETPARGFVLDDPEIGTRLVRRWDYLRGEALPQRQSRQLIVEVAEQWNT
ncbi:helix-turn-helix transcriptional regulator [Haloechinothrix sp. LS1_15]|uniref:helix-turn-helix domain-containing protein n=1 Tax=Haloechinothrix sp. LS1_15 TaxID=2652248 RepID=UPI00294B8275|nr:helix-turn-helix transcriptional regulator [Haloechinothrix sp. LS1_15]